MLDKFSADFADFGLIRKNMSTRKVLKHAIRENILHTKSKKKIMNLLKKRYLVKETS